ncbi:MAG: hypothetical protein QF569_09330 [Candidatus Poribacteria bacterium]|nr:hypothetical protein [Candidatus Poribacteria bacterium]
MRVTHKMISNQTTTDLQRGLEEIQTAIDKVSSGQKLRALSDDPAELKVAMSLRKEYSINVQHASNNEKATFRLNQIDSIIGQVNDTLVLLNQFATDVSGKIGSKDAAKELDKLRTQLKQLGNTKVLNQYIFAGTKTTQSPFVEADGTISYQGNTSAINLEIGDDLNVQVNMVGSKVFGTDQKGVFQVLDTLQKLIEQQDLGVTDETSKHAISSGTLKKTDGAIADANTNLENLMDMNLADTIQLSGMDTFGQTVSKTISFSSSPTTILVDGNSTAYSSTVQGFLDLLKDTYGDVSTHVDSTGKIVVADNGIEGESSTLSVNIEPQDQNSDGILLDFGSMALTQKIREVHASDFALTDQVTSEIAIGSTRLADLAAQDRQPMIGETITISGTDPDGDGIKKTFKFMVSPPTDADGNPIADSNGIYGIDLGTATVDDLIRSIELSFNGEINASIDATGKFVIQDKIAGDSQISLSVTPNNEGGGDLYFGLFAVTTEGDDDPDPLSTRIQRQMQTNVTGLIDNIGSVTSSNSTRIQMVGDNEDKLAVKKSSLESQLKEVEGIDQAEALTELREFESAYKSALTTAGKAAQPSLIDILG